MLGQYQEVRTTTSTRNRPDQGEENSYGSQGETDGPGPAEQQING